MSLNMAERELRAGLSVIMILACILEIAGSETPEVVNRREVGDTYQLSGSSIEVCNEGDNLTYLVSEQRCVRNQELLNERGCRLSVAPNEETFHLTLTLMISKSNRQLLQHIQLLMTATTRSSSNQLINATIVYNGTLAVSSICHIVSLEVYRGINDVTRISHDGFSLSTSGMIEIDNTSLAYSLEEYLGELYRMNLSCSGGGLPESGCLFFKVIGKTNVTTSKFENRVPGNVSDHEINFSSTISNTSLITTEVSRIGTSDSMANSESTPSSGPDLFIYIIVAATGIVALLFVVVLLCMVLAYCYSLDRKRRGVTVATNLWFEQRDLIAINNPHGTLHDANTPDILQ